MPVPSNDEDPSPKVVLFDLDGTLTDSAPGILAGLRFALSAMDLPEPDPATMRTFLGPPLNVTFAEHFGLSSAHVDEAIRHYRAYYHQGGELQNAVYDGILEVLQSLRGQGAVLAVATSKPTVSATRILEHFELAPSFAVIAGAELDGSRQHKADVIAHALAELQEQGHLTSSPTNADTLVMIGDREHDVLGAARHGIATIGALWGYGTAQELQAAGANALVEQPVDLLPALQRITG